ncbi:MAG: ABC transporter permease, partial [Alphaproteobacteria bacterium]|nr:ABC transporter permease [Alphaproteobacteria bacterium]
MLRYILRRLLLLVPVLVGLSLVVFAISRLLPGDLARLAAGSEATEESIELLRQEFGLDRPLPVQYLNYAVGLVTGDWGRSVVSRRPVLEDLAVYLPATIELVVAAMLLAVLLGVPTGVLSAVYRDRWPDYVSRVLSLGAISMPRFFLGLLLQLALAMWFGLLPLGGRFPIIEEPPHFVTGLLTIDALIAGDLRA